MNNLPKTGLEFEKKIKFHSLHFVLVGIEDTDEEMNEKDSVNQSKEEKWLEKNVVLEKRKP